MLDFTSVKRGEVSMNGLAARLEMSQLRDLTEKSVSAMLDLLDGMADADVPFVPTDPSARDEASADPSETGLAWTFGHVVAHTTASGDEYAAVAAEFARGVPFHGRPRYETPWPSMTTLARCRQRLVESRRIRLASLEMWPDEPHLDIGTAYWSTSGWVNAKGIFTWGLAHDADHQRQLGGIRAQALTARGEVS